MTLEITFVATIAFVYTSILLAIFSISDLRKRQVRNEMIGFGMVIGVLLGVATNHLIDLVILHLSATIIAALIGFGLFRLKSIGGADAKSILIIAIVSPGIEFAVFENLIYEALIGSLVPILCMLLLGYIYYRKKPAADDKTTPLIPFLFLGYLLVQIIALI